MTVTWNSPKSKKAANEQNEFSFQQYIGHPTTSEVPLSATTFTCLRARFTASDRNLRSRKDTDTRTGWSMEPQTGRATPDANTWWHSRCQTLKSIPSLKVPRNFKVCMYTYDLDKNNKKRHEMGVSSFSFNAPLFRRSINRNWLILKNVEGK